MSHEQKQGEVKTPQPGQTQAAMPRSHGRSQVSVVEQLIGFRDRLTYIFAHDQEVGSIHFDKLRGDIFYKGHNIRHLSLEDWQWEALESLRVMLREHPKYQTLAVAYGMTLDKIVLEMKRGSVK